MKKIILILSFISILTSGFAQNELKAQIEFEEAEKSIAENNFDEAYVKLVKTQTLIGKWSPNISYLKIICLDALCDYEKYTSSYTQLLFKEVPLYMKFANEHKGAVVMDKFREVYAIEEKIKIAAQREKDSKDPELLVLETKNSENIEQYKNVANKENMRAMIHIGYMYEKGIGVAKDATEAMTWYHKAAVNGSLAAMCIIAHMYVYGDAEFDVNKDYTQAILWYKKAAEKGSTLAMHYLADIYNEEEVGDYMQAMNWYKKLTVKGDIFAHKQIGNLYQRGNGVTRNYNEALRWYKIALEKTNIDQREVGMFYRVIGDLYYMGGFGILQNYGEAIKFHKLSADRGDADAMRRLSGMYRDGKGIEKDENIANEWSDKESVARKR